MPVPNVSQRDKSLDVRSGEHEPVSGHSNAGVDAVVPVRLGPAAWAGAARSTFTSAVDLETSIRCAGVAFFGFLSFFPAISAAVALAGLAADPLAIMQRDLALSDAIPDEVTTLVTEQVAAFAARETKLSIGLAASILIALWTGSRGMNALVYAITRAHKEEDGRGFLSGVVTSLLVTIGAFATLAIIVISVTVIPVATMIWPFAEGREIAALWLRWPVVAAVLSAAVFLLYRYAPNRRSPRTHWVVPGAVLATLLWLLGSVGLSFFVENFGRYDTTFGSIAAAAVFMLWLYFSAVVLVSGATLNAELEWRTHRDTTVGPDRPMGKRNAHVADTLAEGAKRQLGNAD